ncbi:hypothetical protein WJX72_004050 [[Myrmecia] bisecta]|uniref:Zinc-finger domain-containing protein n=1 Tax=[Myrmecia] bisecta TaxID=41462 RepID=A0AAW1QQV4_9CHLO
MALCAYELERDERIANNLRRLQELRIDQLADNLAKDAAAIQQRPPRLPRALPAKPPIRLQDVPKRRSARNVGAPAPVYNDNVLDAIDLPRKRRALPDFLAVSHEEKYTQEHVDALGSHEEPWTLFVDGYDASGNRIYDKVNGKTCHQCRQKTLGLHTSCSDCQSLQGTFCGDCLFMRYGENIKEVAKNPNWKCPGCRDLCNCSFHRTRRGWAPTGTLYRRAVAEGYLSVSHYLVFTNLASDKDAAAVEEGAAANVAEPATTTCHDEAVADAAEITLPAPVVSARRNTRRSSVEQTVTEPAKTKAAAAVGKRKTKQSLSVTPAVTKKAGKTRAAAAQHAKLNIILPAIRANAPATVTAKAATKGSKGKAQADKGLGASPIRRSSRFTTA